MYTRSVGYRTSTLGHFITLFQLKNASVTCGVFLFVQFRLESRGGKISDTSIFFSLELLKPCLQMELKNTNRSVEAFFFVIKKKIRFLNIITTTASKNVTPEKYLSWYPWCFGD